MCLLIGQKKQAVTSNNKVSNNQLRNAWARNNDGVGYAFAINGRIETRKFMEFKPFKKSFNQDVAKYGNQSAFLIHFRFATHGNTDLSNVHPFKVNDNLVFGHNGVINNVDDDNILSDTQVFNNLILKGLNPDFLSNDSLRTLISDFIGNSKLCFLDSNGNLDFINADLGHFNDNKSIWFSNDGYKKQKPIYIGGGAWNSQKWDNVNNCYLGNYGFKSSTTKPNKSRAKSIKESIKTYADNTFLKCDYCNTETDVLYRYNYADICEDCKTVSQDMTI